MMKPTADSNTQAPPGLSIVDAACLVVFCVTLLVASYLHSRHRMFWGDEIMGLLVMQQPNWHVLLHLWDAGIDSSGVFFYVLGRPWLAVFGASEVSLREFSAAGVAASAVVLWVAARRYYSLLTVAAAMSFIFSATLALSWQLSNGRTYGLFLLGNALVMFLLLRGEDAERARPSGLFLVATFAAYTLLVGSHILGFLYAGAYVTMQVGFDLYARRFSGRALRPLLYGSALLGFWVLLISRANLTSTAALGKPSYWTIQPALRTVIQGRIALDDRVNVPMGLLALLLIVTWRLRLRRERTPVYLLVLGFVGLDAAIFLISRLGTSIYVDRYLVPFSLIAVLLFCELFTQIRDADAPLPAVRAAVSWLFLLAAVPLFFLPRLQRPWLPVPNYTAAVLALAQPSLPVVDTDVGSYVEMEFYHHGQFGRPFLFPVDWQVALDPHTVGGVSGFHEMDNFKAMDLYADGIVPTADILSRYPDFLVITGKDPTMWLKRRILDNPAYQAVKQASYGKGQIVELDIWRVHRR